MPLNSFQTSGNSPGACRVGILGFVPAELHKEQLPIVLETKPDFAIIAGGRPSQVAELEQQGIATYLHVPSPGLLEAFLRLYARDSGKRVGGGPSRRARSDAR